MSDSINEAPPELKSVATLNNARAGEALARAEIWRAVARLTDVIAKCAENGMALLLEDVKSKLSR